MNTSITVRMNAERDDITITDKGVTTVIDRAPMERKERKKLARLVAAAWEKAHG